MTIQVRTSVRDCVTIREQVVPPDYVVVDTYHPCSSTTPWDYHGGKHVREIKKVLLAANIESVSLVESHTHISPTGSGPNGRVRFGDNMMPGVYRVAVPEHDAPAAEAAIAAHKAKLDLWMDGGCELPLACRG